MFFSRFVIQQDLLLQRRFDVGFRQSHRRPSGGESNRVKILVDDLPQAASPWAALPASFWGTFTVRGTPDVFSFNDVVGPRTSERGFLHECSERRWLVIEHREQRVQPKSGGQAMGSQAVEIGQPFVRRRTALLTSFKRDGTPVRTPLTIAVEDGHAFVRTYDRAWKSRRMRNHPVVEIAPSTIRGKPRGDAIRARSRLLEGDEARHAARAIAR